jgi:hypothetical protein
VHVACRELIRCVRELGAVGSFIRPNLVNGHLLALELLGPALYPARGAGRDVGLPRGHRGALLPHEHPLRREPLLSPRGQPLDRDAAGADRDDHRRSVRVSTEAPGGVSSRRRTPGRPGSSRASSGTTRSTGTRTRRISR